jgi:hypothetical protein
MLIDEFMPAFDVAERHGIVIRARAERAYAGIRSVDLTRSFVIRSLFALRRFPAVYAGRGAGRRGLMLDDFLRSGFVVLAEEPGVEIVLGVIGRFWRPTGGLVGFAPDEFTAFKQPGYAKAAWNFRVEPEGEGRVRVVTHTRIRATDEKSLRSFRRYWLVVGPFSGLIRREMLRLVRSQAEGGQ